MAKHSKPIDKADKASAGYEGHDAGSRKGKVHRLYDTKGPEHAWTLGLKLKLKPSTLRTWFGIWQRGA